MGILSVAIAPIRLNSKLNREGNLREITKLAKFRSSGLSGLSTSCGNVLRREFHPKLLPLLDLIK